MGHMSNRERIARAQAEAAAKQAQGGSRKSAGEPRMKVVWTVCSSTGKVIESFPYSDKARAEARVGELSASTGDTHELRQAKVPMD